ncbi:unnamed protein product [Amoebophrya sp. A120]|nr:unnamed protein product [Amoebophrya sp. A120]|eukprot:GSA120T00002398001.1
MDSAPPQHAEDTPRGLDAVIVGSIGVVAHCSRLQWRCFNQALCEFRDSGELIIPAKLDAAPEDHGSLEEEEILWPREQYIASLTSTGGAKRLREFFSNNYAVEDETNLSDELCARIHHRKSEIFAERIYQIKLNGATTAPEVQFSLRPGVLAFLRAARRNNVKVGFCAPTERVVIDAFLDVLNLRDLFDVYITADDRGVRYPDKGKPEPDCYQYVVGQLFASPAVEDSSTGQQHDGSGLPEQTPTPPENPAALEEVIKTKSLLALEDTWISMQSPLAAGIPTLALPSEWAVGQDFTQALSCCAELPDLVTEAEAITNGFVKASVSDNQIFPQRSASSMASDSTIDRSDVSYPVEPLDNQLGDKLLSAAGRILFEKADRTGRAT